MNFKVGDKVRYKAGTNAPEWYGFEGTVESCNGEATTATASTTGKYFSPGSRHRLTTENLELIEEPKPFSIKFYLLQRLTYEDIQVGDKIRRTLTRPSGTTQSTEGVVAVKGFNEVADSEGYKLAYATDDNPWKCKVVLELLDRPKPKHWAETKPVGSVGIILDAFHTKILTKTSEYGWNVLYPSDGYTYKDTNKALERRSVQWDESKIHWIK